MFLHRHSLAHPHGSKSAPSVATAVRWEALHAFCRANGWGLIENDSQALAPWAQEIWAGHLQSRLLIQVQHGTGICLGFVWWFLWKVSPISRNQKYQNCISNSPTQDIKWLKWDKSQRQVTTGVLFVAPPVDHPMLGFPDDMLTFFVDVGLHWALNEV